MSYSYQNTYDELNIRLGDSADTTFTPEEKASALKKAWNDSYVVKRVLDTTTLWASNTFGYAVPATMSAVTDIYTHDAVDSGDEPIDASLWEVIDGNIVFRTRATVLFNAGASVYIKGIYKYKWASDSLPNENLYEYVVASAGFNTLSLLGFKKANLFLKNDTTMSELVTLRREFDTERKDLRSKLPVETQSA